MDELAVFPLDVVVFPGMTVPLHVYEERYKRLVRHASGLTPSRFVIAPPPGPALAAEGSARPGTIGSIVELLETDVNPDGTYAVVGHGRERCRLEAVREERVPEQGGIERPLWFATAEPWPLEREDPNRERIAAWDAVDAFRRYGDVFFADGARRQADEALPSDPLYQASFVCANLRLPTERAQRLLEAPSLSARFEAATEAIDERLEEALPGSGGDASRA